MQRPVKVNWGMMPANYNEYLPSSENNGVELIAIRLENEACLSCAGYVTIAVDLRNLFHLKTSHVILLCDS